MPSRLTVYFRSKSTIYIFKESEEMLELRDLLLIVMI
jgi:hypothetical protein